MFAWKLAKCSTWEARASTTERRQTVLTCVAPTLLTVKRKILGGEKGSRCCLLKERGIDVILPVFNAALQKHLTYCLYSIQVLALAISLTFQLDMLECNHMASIH